MQDNTIVVYTSDHGDMMGSHGLVAKCTQYQEDVSVPLIIHIPWLMQPARRIAAPVSQVDLVPTLLDLLDQPAPSHLHGRSWRPRLESEAEFPREDVFVQWNGPNNGLGDIRGRVSLPKDLEQMAPADQAIASSTDPVRTIIAPDNWKLNCSPLGEHELYYLSADRGETRNLVRDPAHRTLIQDLYRRILSWQQRVADPVDLSGCRFP
jgi:hypothetical protein